MTSREMLCYLCLELPVKIIIYSLSVWEIMWEKESDTRCLLRSTVLKLVQKVFFSSLNNTLLNSFKNCWSKETTHDGSSMSAKSSYYNYSFGTYWKQE